MAELGRARRLAARASTTRRLPVDSVAMKRITAPDRLLAVTLIGFFGCGAPDPPNLLLVVIDTLRADHTSTYGYARDTTPRLSALATEGALFRQAYAPMGLTGPSHATLFTSLHPLSHGVAQNGLALDDSATTLAEILAGAGYQTAAFVSSFVLDDRFGLSQGFETYDDALDPGESTLEVDTWEGHGVERGFDRRADHTARRAVAWLREARDAERPFFLFVHFFDPHSPWEPIESRFESQLSDPSELERQVARYDAEIAYTDARLGELVDALEAGDLATETLVLVTADHGEGLMQRGYLLHGLGVTEEEVRVPLVARWPGRVPAGTVVDEPVALLDVLPSVLDALGIAHPALANGELQGHSFAAALRGQGRLDPQRAIHLQRRRLRPAIVRPDLAAEGPDGNDIAPFAVEGEQFGLRRGRWKYVSAPSEGRGGLFDLETDPGEREALDLREPERAAQMRDDLEAWVEAQRRRPSEGSVSPDDRRRLRALGYID